MLDHYRSDIDLSSILAQKQFYIRGVSRYSVVVFFVVVVVLFFWFFFFFFFLLFCCCCFPRGAPYEYWQHMFSKRNKLLTILFESPLSGAMD